MVATKANAYVSGRRSSFGDPRAVPPGPPLVGGRNGGIIPGKGGIGGIPGGKNGGIPGKAGADATDVLMSTLGIIGGIRGGTTTETQVLIKTRCGSNFQLNLFFNHYALQLKHKKRY